MKIIILTCIIFAISCSNYQREFLTGFVRAVSNDKEYVLKPDCFGSDSDEYFKLTIQGLVSLNLDNVVEGLSTIATIYYFNCPSEPRFALNDYISNIKNLTVLKNTFKNSLNILKFKVKVLKFISEKNYYETGYNLGKIFNSIIYDNNYKIY